MGENTEIIKQIERLYEEGDQAAFEIMHRIAALAVSQSVEVLTE